MERVFEEFLESTRQAESQMVSDRLAYIHDLISASNTQRERLSLGIMSQNHDRVVVTFGYNKAKTILFTANSKEEIELLAQVGEVIQESNTDMMLANQHATAWEVNKRLPNYLKKYYPEVAEVLPKEKQKIPTKRGKLAATA